MEEIQRIIDGIDPQKALTEISRVLNVLFSTLGEEARHSSKSMVP